MLYIYESIKFSLIMIGTYYMKEKGKLVGIRLLNADEYKIDVIYFT